MKTIFSKRLIPFYLILIVFIADQLSKWWVDAHLPVMKQYWLWYPYGGIPVFKNFLGIEFSITHQINYGAAWGVLADFQIPLLYLRIILTIALVIYLVFFNKHQSWQIPLSLIIAGALGNIVDNFHFGHVVDMFHFVLWGYDFPVFNLADTSIFIGIVWLVIISSFSHKAPAKKRR